MFSYQIVIFCLKDEWNVTWTDIVRPSWHFFLRFPWQFYYRLTGIIQARYLFNRPHFSLDWLVKLNVNVTNNRMLRKRTRLRCSRLLAADAIDCQLYTKITFPTLPTRLRSSRRPLFIPPRRVRMCPLLSEPVWACLIDMPTVWFNSKRN